jgi:hypothetical protein
MKASLLQSLCVHNLTLPLNLFADIPKQLGTFCNLLTCFYHGGKTLILLFCCSQYSNEVIYLEYGFKMV